MKLAEKVLMTMKEASKDIRDENVALKLIKKVVKKKLEFDDYDMNDYPLFLDSNDNEYWIDEKGDIYTNGDRGNNKKLGKVNIEENITKDIIEGKSGDYHLKIHVKDASKIRESMYGLFAEVSILKEKLSPIFAGDSKLKSTIMNLDKAVVELEKQMKQYPWD